MCLLAAASRNACIHSDSDTHMQAAPASRQAAARQQQFETSAVGKAATKAVREAKAKPQVQQNERSSAQASSNARDWLS